MSVAYADTPAPDWVEDLKRQGYCIIPDLMPKTKVAALWDDLRERFANTPFCDGEFYGSHTKRFGGLLKRSRHAEAFVMNATILDIARRVLGPFCSSIQLNLTQALEIWPGELEQCPHRDQNMWRGPVGEIEYLINVMWPFTPYRAENGATVIWPGSHFCQNDHEIPREQAVSVEMDPGSCLVFLGSTHHGAGANRTATPRTGMIVSYNLGWLKPYENQWLVYPPEIARTFSPELAAMVGYRMHQPNLGNYEGQCPSVLLKDNVPEYIHAVDDLREDQVAWIAEFKARQGENPVLG